MRRTVCLPLTAALALLTTAARAQGSYKIQPILTTGDMVGDRPVTGLMRLLRLNDQGQLLVAASLRGSSLRSLFLYREGKLSPILIRGEAAPGGGIWADGGINGNMNQAGNVVLQGPVKVGGKVSYGTFFWEAASQKLSVVAAPEMPAVENLTFVSGEASAFPSINNRDEMVFDGFVRNAARATLDGAFFRGSDGRIQVVALPGQPLAGGGSLLRFVGTLNLMDTGVVTLRARQQGDAASAIGGCRWEQGSLSPVLLPGASLPGGATVARVTGIWSNNRNRSLLAAALPDNVTNRYGLYRLTAGQVVTVAVPGQEMPGGGTLQTILHENADASGLANALGDVSLASEAGEHVFRARLEDGTRAVYRVDTDGNLRLVLKNGQKTELGTITSLPGGNYINLNSRGQVAVVVRIDNGPETLILLTP